MDFAEFQRTFSILQDLFFLMLHLAKWKIAFIKMKQHVIFLLFDCALIPIYFHFIYK